MAAVYEQAQPVKNPSCIVETHHTGPSVRFHLEGRPDSRRGEESQNTARTPLKVERKADEGFVLERSSRGILEDAYEEAHPIQLQMNGTLSSSDDTAEDKTTLRGQLYMLRHLKSRSKLHMICVITTFCAVIPVIFMTSGLVIGMHMCTQQPRGQTIASTVVVTNTTPRADRQSSTAQLHTRMSGFTHVHNAMAQVPKKSTHDAKTGSVDVTRWNHAFKNGSPFSMFHGPDSTDGKNCPRDYTMFREICYKAPNYTAGYRRSRLYCGQEAGGTLAMPRDRQINDFLVSLKNSVDPAARFRFGLHDRVTENYWQWMNGERLAVGQFSDWGPGEPNDYQYAAEEDCVEYFEALKGNGWNDASCNLKRKFICEVSLRQRGLKSSKI